MFPYNYKDINSNVVKDSLQRDNGFIDNLY